MMSDQTSLSAAHSATSSQTYRIPHTNGELRLFFLRPEGRFKQPLRVKAERVAGGHWIMTHAESVSYGVGNTLDEAVDAFKRMVLAYFDELVTSEKTLAPRLKKQLRHLRAVILEEIEK